MGNWLCKSVKIRVVFLGLDGVGKTSLLYHLKLGQIIYPVPTIAFNVETVDIDGIEVTLWDVSSRGKLRALWDHYMSGSQGFVFVIDSADKQRLDEAFEELTRVFQDDRTRDTVFMVLANKQDREGAMSAQQMEDYLLQKNMYYKSSTSLVVPCNALDLEQVNQIFTYFVHLIFLNQAGKLKRGLITLKEQSQIQENSKGLTLKSLLKDAVGYLKSFF